MENQHNPFAVIDRRLENIETLLLEIKHGSQNNNQPPTGSDSDELLTVRQTADFLDLTPASIYGLVHAGKIPGACKRGKRLYFSKQELTDWVKAGRKQTAAELNAKAEQYAISQTKKTRG
jgi:excisionase family DNA binding protein